MRIAFTKSCLTAVFLFFCGSLAAQQAHIGAANYSTIQLAVNAAAPGNVITLDAGVFSENVVINKPLTIQGAGEGQTIIHPALNGPLCGVPASICAGSSNVMLVQAHNVTIRDLTIDGDNPSLTSGVVRSGKDINARNGIITNHSAGLFNNLVVDHVTVKNIYLRGIYASSGGTFTFTNNTVSNVRGEAASIAIMNFNGAGSFLNNSVDNANDGIVSNWSKGSVYKFNTVSNSSSGIHSDNNQVMGDVIENNTVMNSSINGYGIWIFSPYVSATVNANTITNVDVGLANSGQASPAAFPLFSNNVIDCNNRQNSLGVYQTTERWGFGTTNVNGKYEGNVVSNAEIAIYIELSTGRTNNAIAKFNHITGNSLNVIRYAPAGSTLLNDFSCNWWGTNDPGVFASFINLGINYSPWLTSGNDVSAAPGFQPSFSCNGTAADFDGDGIPNAMDCDPLDPSVGTASYTYYSDADGDGFGDPAISITSCSATPPAGYASNNTDCNVHAWTYADNDQDGFGAGSPTACGVTNNYDSDDTDGKPLVWVCHNGNSIIVKANALLAHLAHGDVAGNCNAQQRTITSKNLQNTGMITWNIYPNPARSEVNLTYSLIHNSKVVITMYDILGRQMEVVFNGMQDVGNHKITQPVKKFPAGMYYMRVMVNDGENTSTHTIQFMKTY